VASLNSLALLAWSGVAPRGRRWVPYPELGTASESGCPDHLGLTQPPRLRLSRPTPGRRNSFVRAFQWVECWTARHGAFRLLMGTCACSSKPGVPLCQTGQTGQWTGCPRRRIQNPLIEEVRFARDSPLEEAGFEPSVHRAAGAIETRALRRMLSDSEVDSKVKGRTI
jgi:hypothetical protein